MSETPLDLDLVTAAHVRLSEDPEFVAMVEEGLIGSDEDGTVWLFQGLTDTGAPFRDPEGSGTTVLVLSERREWTGPNSHNSAFFPALQLLIYTDSDRDDEGAPLMRNADRKCKHIFKRLDRIFHLTGPRMDVPWATDDPDDPARDFYVHSCLRASGFEIQDVPGTESFTVRGEAIYNTITD